MGAGCCGSTGSAWCARPKTMASCTCGTLPSLTQSGKTRPRYAACWAEKGRRDKEERVEEIEVALCVREEGTVPCTAAVMCPLCSSSAGHLMQVGAWVHAPSYNGSLYPNLRFDNVKDAVDTLYGHCPHRALIAKHVYGSKITT